MSGRRHGLPEGGLTLGHPLAVALMELAREAGYRATSVTEITARAGVGREGFERDFGSREALALAVLEVGGAELRERVGHAFAAGGRWPGSLRAAAWELARWIREHPTAIHFGVLGLLGAEEMVLVRREELLLWFARLVEEGRAVAADPAAVPRAAPLLLVGAIVGLLRGRLGPDLPAAMPGLVPEMMWLAVRPYLGPDAADAELVLPPPEDFARGPGVPAEPRPTPGF
ncbi:MAG TPA: TetR/AcrR family transcriptional regulator [Solirubrobacterales bacterium]|nr:TetR/AcrR family transcriptional regulator [Solirubrobacterales bacterium]